MTHAQLKPFFRAVSRAASAQGLVGREAVEAYRREVMREEAGADHASDIDPGAGYDRVMYRLAVDVGDWSAASRFVTGAERRMAHLVEQCARQVIELKAIEDNPRAMFVPETVAANHDAVAYVVGCLRQAGLLVTQTPTGDWQVRTLLMTTFLRPVATMRWARS